MKKKKNFIIIGAGWMGCHLALTLMKQGHQVKLFEQKKIFNGMSGANTNRLHMGYHYPRSFQTRMQSKFGYKEFIKKYPTLNKKIKNNLIYLVKKYSLIDFQSYKKIMISSNLKIKKTTYFKDELSNIEGLFKVNEAQILQNKSKKFFKSKLGNSLFENKEVKLDQLKFGKKICFENEYFDYLVDCSAGHLFNKKEFDISYEPRVTWIYRSKLKNFALMAMDGQFYNIFPHNEDFILGTPKYSKYKKINNLRLAIKFVKEIKKKDISKRRFQSEKIVKDTFVNFNKYFIYKSYFISLTTIFNSSSDNRPTLVKKKGNIISVLGGKIDTIFEAEKKIMKMLKIN
tara:strand:- start:6324 stop:7352 length:1029 start_codon:yes stop_codon:yes gene_type:complete